MDYSFDYSYDVGSSSGWLAALGIIPMLIGLAYYIYLAVCLMYMAKKTNTPNGWFGFVPILNIILMLQIAKKPLWWIILLLIPVVNIIVGIIIWMKIAENCGKENWWGILMIVPVVNFIVPAVLAFSQGKVEPQAPPQQPQAPSA